MKYPKYTLAQFDTRFAKRESCSRVGYCCWPERAHPGCFVTYPAIRYIACLKLVALLLRFF